VFWVEELASVFLLLFALICDFFTAEDAEFARNSSEGDAVPVKARSDSPQRHGDTEGNRIEGLVTSSPTIPNIKEPLRHGASATR
jgi:hypothetical protein